MKLEVLGIDLILFLLVLSRWAGFVMLAPVFGGRNVPPYVKLALAIACSLVVFPLVGPGQVPPGEPVSYLFVMIKESLVGLSIGFISQQLLFVIQGAGQLIDLQMGLSLGNMLDPVNASPAPLTGNFKVILALMFLLASNAHHYLIAAMVRSYQYIPFMDTGPSPKLLDYGINFLAGTFFGAVQIALPVAGVLVLAELALGFLAKALPQMNIFLLGFPLKLGLGFLLLLWLVPLMGSQVDNLFQDSLKQIQLFLQGWTSP